MAAPKNNKFAEKSEKDALTACTHVYTTKSERKLLLQASAGGGLSAWCRETLLKAAQDQHPPKNEH